MGAIVVRSIGGPAVLQWEPVAPRDLDADQIRIEPAAIGVNYIDTYHRSGLYSVGLPFTPGLEGAGTVTEKGPGVKGVELGDRVAWTDQLGSYAEDIVITADRAVRVPASLSLETAAALMLQGITAHYLTNDTFALGVEHRCLIHAGAGGVGLLLIQLAKEAGAQVFATVSTPEKAELASAAGADHIVGYADFTDDIERLVGPKALDVVYDGVGLATFSRGLGLLRPRGLMALFGRASGAVPALDLGVLAQHGSLHVTSPSLGDHISDGKALSDRVGALFSATLAGRLEVRIGQTWPLRDAAAAHRQLESRASTGKILLLA